MNLIEKLEKSITFLQKYSKLKNAATRVEKNIEEAELNNHLICGFDDKIDKIAKYQIISKSSIIAIGLEGINIGIKNLQPITAKQIKKKEKLTETYTSLQSRYSKIYPENEVEETV